MLKSVAHSSAACRHRLFNGRCSNGPHLGVGSSEEHLFGHVQCDFELSPFPKVVHVEVSKTPSITTVTRVTRVHHGNMGLLFEGELRRQQSTGDLRCLACPRAVSDFEQQAESFRHLPTKSRDSWFLRKLGEVSSCCYSTAEAAPISEQFLSFHR